ncbi:MAG: 2,3-diphosphoglycerate-dependent phosphoglycerate mutase [Candidatus Levybacteria bacterium]|nr:2,3-diphosphoglycerate-dependent phosphoglycerate mutase [Candidatus Levybacteria bacterium]
MAYLSLVRHGESEWNAKGLWTGLTDIVLSEKGRQEARLAGEKIKDIPINVVYNSKLLRAKQTWEEIQKVAHYQNVEMFEDRALNERDYGIYTGRNKWDVKKEVGEEGFRKIRRSWDSPIPNGESLKQVYQRVIPYYQSDILPKLREGKNILISAHGNSLRALIKYLEDISDADIPNLELPTGGVYIYQINQNGQVISNEIR